MNKVKNVYKRFKGFFPSLTPVGVTEFYAWADDIIDTYKPAADNVSIYFALTAMLMRLGPTEAYKSKRFFALCLHKGAASQVANGVMYDIKMKQAELEKAAQEAAKPVEVTTLPESASPNEQIQILSQS